MSTMQENTQKGHENPCVQIQKGGGIRFPARLMERAYAKGTRNVHLLLDVSRAIAGIKPADSKDPFTVPLHKENNWLVITDCWALLARWGIPILEEGPINYPAYSNEGSQIVLFLPD